MKKILLVNFVLLLMAVTAWAQERTVTGKVTAAEDGTPIPGVNIFVKGTTLGTTTDAEGKYSLVVPAGATLIFSFIGNATQEIAVGERSSLDVRLSQDSKELDEVVVTAIGVERSSKSLGYSATRIDQDEIVQGRNPSILSSLQGKLAGVQISNGSGAPGSSNKVIIRGYTSLGGGNNPLYVIDGMPIDNTFTGSTALAGGSDFGNRVNDINPEDVESISVLRGAAATSLYGSRASSGVILITTKKGKDAALIGKKAQITVSSSLLAENVYKLPTFQNKFGQGFLGSTSEYLNENTSWGSRFDGQDRVWGRVVGNQQRVKQFSPLRNNIREFFETGKTFTNSISMQGGNQTSNYYVSFSNVNGDGVMPTDVDSYKRNTIGVRGATQFANNFSSSASINYARTDISQTPTGQGGSVYNQILQTPRDISLLELSDVNNPFNDLNGYYSEFTINPWYALKNYGAKGVIDKLYGHVELGYKASDWLNFTARVGTDLSVSQQRNWVPKMVITGPNASKADPGNFSISETYRREFNTDLIANMAKQLNSDFSINGLIGFNINQRQIRSQSSTINDIVIPNFYHLSNTANSPTTANASSFRRLIGLYAQANLSFRDYLFLTVSARNDWSSTLPEDGRSFFYPGVNAAIDLTSALNIESRVLSYAKIRASWAQAGKDAAPYSIQSVFVQAGHNDGFISLNAPYAQAIPAFEVSNTIGNPNLQPEISTDIELGFDVRFLNNRLGVDATFYQRNVRDNILSVPVTASSGFTTQVLNIAELRNRGIELMLTTVPVIAGKFRWEASINWSKNDSRILDVGGPSQISVGGLGSNALIARVGGPAFEIEGNAPVRDAQGRIVVNAAGLPIADPNQKVLGNTQYNFIAGVTNRFSFNGLTLATTFDIRDGGIMYSRTASMVHFAGTTPATTFNDRNPFIVPNSAQQVVGSDGTPLRDDNGFIITTENTTPLLYTDQSITNYWVDGGSKLDRAFLVSKSYIKLREVVLSYSLPKSLLQRTPFGNVDISLIGRNLFLWVPKDNVFIDPEQTTFGTDIGSEFGEFGAAPPTRSYGFNIRLTL